MAASPEKINKLKILNDPVYGFVSIPYELIHDLMEHPWFQRLRRIKQTGLSHLVYPGALHTRFHHALGAMHLMQDAIKNIREKGHEITEEEAEGACVAILLHDIGHGPFSHALEFSLVKGIDHEDLSLMFMERLNEEFDGRLSTGIQIFKNRYPKKFLHQLVSSQLDMDRLDYLARDTFFTGVSEGTVSNQRILKMLNVVDDNLVVEQKGIYSIEKFIVARRLMYWQVYLHKTVLSAEFMLVKILERAKELAGNGVEMFTTPSLHTFLYQSIGREDFERNPQVFERFARLDDYDLMTALKVWQDHDDRTLSDLCSRIVNRRLFRTELRDRPFTKPEVTEIQNRVKSALGVGDDEISYFVIQNSITNNAYDPANARINIRLKDGRVIDITEASDNFNIRAQTDPVKKYFLCYPKGL